MSEMTYGTLTTNACDTAVAAALAAETTVTFTYLAVGDSGGSYHEPAKNQTALRGEKWRGPCMVGHDPGNPKRVVITASIPSNVGGFQVREAGVFDSTGTLMIVSKQPISDKVAPGSGASKDMVIRLYVEVVDQIAVTITVDASAQFVTHPELDAILQDRAGGVAVIPAGSDLPLSERKAGTFYLKVTETQSSMADGIRVSPTMALKVDMGRSKSGIDFT